MPDLPTNSGGGEDDLFSDSQLTENLLALFSDDPGPNILVQRARFQTAFLNLVGLFTLEFLPTLHGHIVIDHVALQLMMERFHRDAFGVKWFGKNLKASESQLISEPGKLFVLREVKKLGIRVNTESPRLTKVTAAFSFWLSIMRPAHVSVSGIGQPYLTPEQIQQFCGRLNFWMTSTYLSLFGKITVYDDHDAAVRLERIPYDLTYRGLNLSSLEMLYCGIFRPHKEPDGDTAAEAS